MIQWFKNLSVRRKFLLFLSGGMVTLVFDAFVAHYSWTRNSMKWNQWIPVIYGLAAFVGLGLGAVLPLQPRSSRRLVTIYGLLGMLVGLGGVFFHGLGLFEGLEGVEHTVTEIGKAVSTAPPAFAPAAFAGVGLLLLVLPRFTAD